MIIAKANNNYLRLIEKVESWKKNDYFSRIVTNDRIFDYLRMVEFSILANGRIFDYLQIVEFRILRINEYITSDESNAYYSRILICIFDY